MKCFRYAAVMAAALMLLILIPPVLAFAGDSGLYFDQNRNGDGISIQRSGDTVVMHLYTYGAVVCGLPIPPVPSPEPPVLPDDCQPIGQRWFVGTGEIANETAVTGLLYATHGLNYPDGIGDAIGEEFTVGVFTLVREDAGWLLAVERFGPELGPDDYLFSAVFDFTSPLFYATD